MYKRSQVLLLGLILAMVAVAAFVIPSVLLYRAGLRAQQNLLASAVQAEVALIESVARFDARYSREDHPEGARGATLSQILDANNHFRGFGETGEFVLGIRQGDDILFYVPRRAEHTTHEVLVPLNSTRALPMKLALQGGSGVVEGPDYAGTTVLAAYAPVAGLDLGVVAKIALAELRRPFLHAALIGTGGVVVVIAVGTLLLLQILKALERAQNTSLRKERLAVLGRVAASVSHELRNPLGTIDLSLASLQRQVDPANQALAKPIARARANVGRCVGIVEDMLEHTRNPEPRLSAVALDAWLRETLEDYPWPSGVALDLHLGAGDEQVRLDPERFRRVVLNLVGNACDAMLQARREGAGGANALRVATRADADGLCLTVSDEGIGLPTPAGDRSRLFEPLFSTKSMGVGLGLSIARKIVDAHGGTLVLANRSDVRGVEAVVRIPRIGA